MKARPCLAALVAAPFLLLATGAHADPAGKTTLEETLAPSGGTYSTLAARQGREVHRPPGGSAKARASAEPPSGARCWSFAQLTDPQIADEMSPARVDFADPAGGELKSSWRPQEALGLQALRLRRSATSTPTARARSSQGNGKRARLAFAITTGDLADNQQLNETRWFKTVLDGGSVDPFSGVPVTNQCGDEPADTLARVNADVAARRYTGVADYDDYRDAPQDRFAGFYDPDEAAPTAGPYAAFPRYPGLLDAAQKPFAAAGLRRAVVHLARQPRRPRAGQRARQRGPVPGDRHRLPEGVPQRPVRPEAVRRRVGRRAVRRLRRPGVHPAAAGRRQDRRARSRPADHLQARVPRADRPRVRATRPKKQLNASDGTASYYAWTPEEGLPLHLARHGRRGRRPERQHRRPAVQVAAAAS